MGLASAIIKTLLRYFFVFLFFLLLIALVLWGTLAFYYSSWGPTLRITLAIVYPLLSCLIFIAIRPLRRAYLIFAFLFGAVLIAWFLMFPSNDRNWKLDVAVLPYAEVDGNLITVNNIRNLDYSTAETFDVNYYDKTFDLSKLESVDLYLVNWGVPAFAHTMISFGFGNDDYLCFSFETRKEEGESYSALKGFFRKYEEICIAGDERDLVRLRTNFRKGENVCLYRIKPVDENSMKPIFLEYIAQINRLKQKPKWYNALTSNCMTSSFKLLRKHSTKERGRRSWQILINGYAAEYFYSLGTIDTSLPFEELKEISCVNDRANSSDDPSDYSARIRVGLPGISDNQSVAK